MMRFIVTDPILSPKRPWGKLARDEQGRISNWQSLAEHSDDVASVFRALVTLPGIRRRLGLTAGTKGLESGIIERLAYLVFLHDCGKINTGFQARIDPKALSVGHIAPLSALFGQRLDRETSAFAFRSIRANVLGDWGAGVISLLDAVFSHHGKPWPKDDDGRLYAKHWRTTDDYDPIAELETLRASADARFPQALAPDIPELPSAARFIHAIAGLVQLSDWIGSSGWTRDRRTLTNDAWAAKTLRDIGLDPEPWRNTLDANALGFTQLFCRDPYGHQTACGEVSGRLAILEAETGSGKTEAAIWRFVNLFSRGEVDGMYFALPTRTAAAQLYGRVGLALQRLWPTHLPPTVIAVPGYLSDSDDGGLPRSTDTLDAIEGDARETRTWAAEHPKRFFSAMVGVGTIDQALLATLRVKHAHLRASSLMRHLLVVDEVHASDPYMQRLLEQLLADHLAAGGYALLLSATLGAESRQALIASALGDRVRDIAPLSLSDAVRVPYPLISADRLQFNVSGGSGTRSKIVRITTAQVIGDESRIAELALAAASDGAKVLVVRNTVAGAIAVQRAIEAITTDEPQFSFSVAGRRTLHHGRFAREDRRLLDDAVQQTIGRARPRGGMIVVGTQTLEQSLDIDADFLLTDLCPIDVLLQRIGRLHRHETDARGAPRERPDAFRNAQCVVLEPAEGLADFIAPRGRAGGAMRHGLGHVEVEGTVRGVYADVTVLEATRRLVIDQAEWIIPEMNRQLVERGLHSEAIEALLEGLPAAQRDEWRTHRNRVLGNDLAKQASASGSMLRRNRDFMEQGVEDTARIATRLGADDRLIRLPAGTVGPFGTTVLQLSVPGWMLRGIEADAAVSISASELANTMLISVGAQQFRYDAHGLHLIARNR